MVKEGGFASAECDFNVVVAGCDEEAVEAFVCSNSVEDFEE